VEIFHILAKLLHEKGYDTAKGDEGGFAPNMKNNTEPLEFIMNAIKKAGLIPGKDVYIALDPAASEFYDKAKKVYHLKGENKKLTTKEMVDY
jgi:enolase